MRGIIKSRKEKWEEKHGYFRRLNKEIAYEKKMPIGRKPKKRK